ncbi:MAG: S8 family serine peptidase [Deltaproteobacteria bacterium]|nr:S8 family serine peptidase [Deltaproteobacteria bacterium]MDQ3301509.1 S8 family serine peptidase [Myxococcota bacterium]
MVADKVGTPPWKLALAGVIAMTVATVQQWSPCMSRVAIDQAPSADPYADHMWPWLRTNPVLPASITSASGPLRYLHVEFANAVEATRACTATAFEPMFSRVGTFAASDPRARWARVEVAEADVAAALRLLANDPRIAQAFVAPDITLPRSPHSSFRAVEDDASCPITTPSFESYQGYLGPAPHGIDAPAAWRRGHRGAGVWFADVEGGWNAAHEDLPGDRITHVVGEPIPDRTWRAHGTAVLGEVVGRDNGKGVVGIAPDVERIFTASIGGIAVADAIDVVASRLRPGDVLLIELQGGGPRGRYIPVEYWDDIYLAIEAATNRGVVVIEAAGNGDENLDHPGYQRAFDRSYRDSGAIMVGAGAPPREGFSDRERLDFSNHGTRVDVQGWGRKVATLDYGDLQACDGSERHYTDRHYTGEFSGTSSASPIVAGAAVLLEGIARQRGRVLPPAELRELLRATGTPQAGDIREQIGPRPDLERAIAALRSGSR